MHSCEGKALWCGTACVCTACEDVRAALDVFVDREAGSDTARTSNFEMAGVERGHSICFSVFPSFGVPTTTYADRSDLQNPATSMCWENVHVRGASEFSHYFLKVVYQRLDWGHINPVHIYT